MPSLTWDAVRRRRLARHFLVRPAPRAGLVDVARAVCGIHAQLMSSAELSLGLRVVGLTRREVAVALWDEKRLVKTYGIRGTIHLFATDELGLWLAACRANPPANAERRLRDLGLTRAEMDLLVDAIGGSLGDRPLTREELGAAVARRAGAWATERTVAAFGGRWPIWMSAIGEAATAGALIFGPNRGAKVTFERPERWLGATVTPSGDEALREVFRRYLAAYGPATHAEFAQWFAMPAGRARELARSLGDAVVEVDVEGARALDLTGERAPVGSAAAPRALLLPRFDCYVVGSHPRDALVPPPVVERFRASAALPRRARSGRELLSGPMPVLLIDGAVSGVWEQRRAHGAVAIRVRPFVPLRPRDRAEVEAAAARIGEILELDVALSFGRVTARPHL